MRIREVGLLLASFLSAWAGEPFAIRVVDEETGRGVPMVSLKTVNQIQCFTDSNGIVAWNEPGLMNRKVYFKIESPGYRYAGGGQTLEVKEGGKAELRIKRVNVAERLYRVTGQGIYRDSVLTGVPAPIREPVLNAEVLGQDTVRVTPYRGKLFWLWGDTDRAAGPLGNFSTTSATSELPGNGGLEPEAGVDLTYFRRAGGFVKPMADWPVEGMKWLHALMNVRDESGVERLLARYDSVVKDLKPSESGLAVFNDERQEFDRLVVYGKADPAVGPGGVTPLRVRSGGTEYFYFCDMSAWPVVRVRADWESVRDLGRYEVFDGVWKRASTLPKRAQTWLDMETGQPVEAMAKVQWNEFRQRWIGILQKNVGEVWYAEADTPVGPWVYTTRIAEHGKYTFYWPVQHPFFDREGGRVIFFEGTYTDMFSGNPVITPRYNYNQLMYKLRLDDERLFLPAPVYRTKDGRLLMREGVEAADAWRSVVEIAFFALPLNRQRTGTVPVGGLFRALPAKQVETEPSLLGEWECRDAGFALTLKAEGEGLKVRVSGLPEVKGTLSAGKARFLVRDEGTEYDATAALDQGKLAVSWKENGKVERTICERDVTNARWQASSALMPLYYYDGKYTLTPKPGAEPIARVWRNPVQKLALDWEARPAGGVAIRR